ncbi:PepSY-like domain-containing protein [Draconibacterium sp.]|nr:PepSY-like domain-containing protein [Draconibacterium sp.]
MKKLIFIIAVLAFALFACTQTPPQKVANSFAQKFPNVTKVHWEQEEENEWEAEFKMNKKEMSATYDNEGTWLETKVEMNKKELPAVVANVIKEKYSDYKVDEAVEIETPDFKGYEIALEQKEKEIELLITSTGEVTVKMEDEEDEEK